MTLLKASALTPYWEVFSFPPPPAHFITKTQGHLTQMEKLILKPSQKATWNLRLSVREVYRGNKRKSSKKEVDQTVTWNETTAAELHGFLWLGEPTATFWSPANIGSSTKPTTIWLDQYISATGSTETRPDTWRQYSSDLSSKQAFVLNMNQFLCNLI